MAEDKGRDDVRPGEGPQKLDEVHELERQRSPYRDWVEPPDEEGDVGEYATRDPREPPARVEPLVEEEEEE